MAALNCIVCVLSRGRCNRLLQPQGVQAPATSCNLLQPPTTPAAPAAPATSAAHPAPADPTTPAAPATPCSYYSSCNHLQILQTPTIPCNLLQLLQSSTSSYKLLQVLQPSTAPATPAAPAASTTSNNLLLYLRLLRRSCSTCSCCPPEDNYCLQSADQSGVSMETRGKQRQTCVLGVMGAVMGAVDTSSSLTLAANSVCFY